MRAAGGLTSIFQRATLDLRFAQQKTLDPRVTFVRAGSATYVGSDGLIKTAAINEARFDHDPATGKCLGLLVEGPRTNLLVRSEEFDNASWAKASASISANDAESPAGNVTADKYTATNATNNIHLPAVTVSPNTTYQLSFYVKNINATQVRWGILQTSPSVVWIVDPALAAQSYFANIPANGWVRVVKAFTTLSTTTAINVYPIFNVQNGGALHIWGAQLEASPMVTSYIPTTANAVFRYEDLVSITDAAFSSWYNQAAGTLLVAYRSSAFATRGIASFHDGTANERIEVVTNSTDPRLIVVDGGSTQADLDGGSIVAFTMTKTAVAFSANNFSIAHAGAAAVTDTSGTMPTPNRMNVGAGQALNFLLDRIDRLTYWPSRLPNSTLQSLTQ
jgi:hypothetical protein